VHQHRQLAASDRIVHPRHSIAGSRRSLRLAAGGGAGYHRLETHHRAATARHRFGGFDVDTMNKDKLLDDLRVVVSDVEELLRATASQTGDRISEARARAEESLRTARVRLEETGEEVAARTREAARETERYVQDNPWQSVGIAAGLGFLLGYLIGRR